MSEEQETIQIQTEEVPSEKNEKTEQKLPDERVTEKEKKRGEQAFNLAIKT